MNHQMNHYQEYLIHEFTELYLEKQMSRRDMLKRVLAVTGSIPLAGSMLLAAGCGSDSKEEAKPTMAANPTQVSAAAVVPTAVGPNVAANDPSITVSDVRFPGPASELIAYVARPNRSGQFPAVLIIHENQGLQEHFKDVARRFAKEGFVGLAIDMVSRLGGTKADAALNAAAARADIADVVADLKATVEYMKKQAFIKPTAIGVTGFCLGGGYALEIAFADPDIKAAVPYYGSFRPDLVNDLPKLQAPILALYAGNDTFTRQAPADAFKAAGKTLETKVYAGAGHAFFNDARPAAQPGALGYNAEAALAAWPETLNWLRKYLT